MCLPLFLWASVWVGLTVGCEGPRRDHPASPDGATGDGSLLDAGPAALPGRAWLRDAEGGVLILRGTNVEGASKWAPDFLPPHYQTEADFARLRDLLGMNTVRLLVFWEAVEPAEGHYDEAYLAALRARVDAAGAAGLHVIVDMHQDVFGRGFGGDGAPRWACDEALYARFTPPEEWFLGYFEPEVGACFDRLWTDGPIREAYGAAWRRVAEALHGSPGLFAYELINEPFWGTAAVRAFERRLAPDAYAAWIDAIRVVDSETYVLVAPASAANVGLASDLLPPSRERLVYAPHIYPVGLERGTGWGGSDEMARALTGLVTEDAARMALPAVVTETGVRENVAGGTRFLRQIYDAFDRDRLGVTQWEGGYGDGYALFTEDGEVTAIGEAIARPYPARTAGTPVAWSWDGQRFELTWDEDGLVEGATVVPLPQVAFPRGARVSVDDGSPVTMVGAATIAPRGGRRSLRIEVIEP